MNSEGSTPKWGKDFHTLKFDPNGIAESYCTSCRWKGAWRLSDLAGPDGSRTLSIDGVDVATIILDNDDRLTFRRLDNHPRHETRFWRHDVAFLVHKNVAEPAPPVRYLDDPIDTPER